jgi:hypothetical protein
MNSRHKRPMTIVRSIVLCSLCRLLISVGSGTKILRDFAPADPRSPRRKMYLRRKSDLCCTGLARIILY